METFELKLKDMPEYLLQRITNVLHAHSTALIRLHIDENGKEQALHIGAGTFVSIGDTDGLLTATHVVEKLESRSMLGLLMAREGEIHSYRVPMSSISIISVGRRESDETGPDLSIIILANSGNVATIKASKSFFPLHSESAVLPETNQGVWYTCGTPGEYVTEESNQSGKGRILTLHNVCGGGGPDREYMVNDFDYYEFPIDVQKGIPSSFSGMSGGAVWQVTIKKDADGIFVPTKYYLSGVVFYEGIREEGTGSCVRTGERRFRSFVQFHN